MRKRTRHPLFPHFTCHVLSIDIDFLDLSYFSFKTHPGRDNTVNLNIDCEKVVACQRIVKASPVRRVLDGIALLKTIVTATRTSAPMITGIINPASDSRLLTAVDAIKAVAPAGGCVSRKICIAEIDIATEIAIQTYDSDSGMLFPKYRVCAMAITPPVNADNTWPKTVLGDRREKRVRATKRSPPRKCFRKNIKEFAVFRHGCKIKDSKVS